MPACILDQVSDEQRCDLHPCSSSHVVVGLPLNFLLCFALHLADQYVMNSLAEIATIILCACFPVMPRFIQLILSRTSTSRDAESKSSYTAGKNKLGGGAAPLGQRLPGGSEAWVERGEAVAPPRNPYIPLGEHGDDDASRHYYSAGRGGIERRVSIELTSRPSISTCLEEGRRPPKLVYADYDRSDR